MKLYRGQTLLGLIIALSLSSFLLLVVIKFYLYHQQQNQQWYRQLSLQTEFQRILRLIANDIRRAGFRAGNSQLQQDNFHLFEQDGRSWNIAQKTNEIPNSCILFMYDLNGNGCLGTTFTGNSCVKGDKNNTNKIEEELFGYRLYNNMIQTRLGYRNAVIQKCSAPTCASYLSNVACDSTGWGNLLESESYTITYFHFQSLANHQALQISLAGYAKQDKKQIYEASIIVPLLNHKE